MEWEGLTWKEMSGALRCAAILQLKAEKLQHQQIADRLGTTYHSVTAYIKRIKRGSIPGPKAWSRSPEPLIRDIFARADEMNLTGKELSYRSGYNVTTIAFVRQGRTVNPNFRLVRDLGQVVGLELKWERIKK